MALSRVLALGLRPAALALTGRWAPLAAARLRPAATVGALRRFASRESWEAPEDVDIDSVAYGFMASQALFAGLEIGLFDRVAEAGAEGLDITSLRQKCACDSPRLQTLLTALVAVKCLKRSPDGIYTLSPNTAQYLVSSSKQYYGDYLRFQIGRQFYQRMGALPEVMRSGKAPSYASWFSEPSVAETYTQAQHNGSVATAKYLVKKKLQLSGVTSMLDVGGGSGAFSYVFVGEIPTLSSTILELPEVCRTGEIIRATQPKEIADRVKFVAMDATTSQWPVPDNVFDIVLMSYISGSVPEPVILELYSNAIKALRKGGRLLVHDFMVNDSLDGPALGALWGLQHVTVNANGLGLCPGEVIDRMAQAGFDRSKCQTMEMIQGMTKLIVAEKS